MGRYTVEAYAYEDFDADCEDDAEQMMRDAIKNGTIQFEVDAEVMD